MPKTSIKTVLVTAAGQGIGLSSAKRLASDGHRVIATDINPNLLENLADQSNVETVKLDVTDNASVEAFCKTLAPIDALFNCAGFVASGTILDCSDRDWDFSFDLNVKAMYRLIQLTLPQMIERGGGSIINMSSVASSIKGVPNRFAYCASKAAVIGLTKSIAADFVTKGIRCNAICPGTVDSPSLHDRLRDTGDYEKALEDFIARQPMGRVGAPEEIAALVSYLVSDESAFSTGQTFNIDGGWSV